VLALKAPEFGPRRTAVLEDLAVITGARCQRSIEQTSFARVAADDLGGARQAWATRTLSGLLGGRSDRTLLRQRASTVRAELRRAADGVDRTALQERLGRLTGASAIIRVGGATESAQAEGKRRIEAALAAGRAALRDGVVPGGGAALVACMTSLEVLDGDGDAAVGVRLLARALPMPLRTIVANAGIEPFPIVDQSRRDGPSRVYDVVRRAWVDPWATGLVDAVATVSAAVEVAVSGVAAALSTETLVRGGTPEYSREP
jgi:chaperonin GroEL